MACVELDVRDHASIQQAVADALREFSRIDILVNNAGCNIRKPATEVTWDDWNEIVNTNLRGAFFVAQAAAWQMIPRRYGRIINIGSVTCVAGYAGLAPYGASRGGIKQMTMSLAHDWGQHGITVNCLAPGWFKTAQNRALYDDPGWVEYLSERIPLGRPGETGRSRRGAIAIGVRRRALHHGPDAAGGRRDFGGGAASACPRGSAPGQARRLTDGASQFL